MWWQRRCKRLRGGGAAGICNCGEAGVDPCGGGTAAYNTTPHGGPSVGAWLSVGVARRRDAGRRGPVVGSGVRPCALSTSGGGPWLQRLWSHKESLSLAKLKVEDVFFAPLVATMVALPPAAASVELAWRSPWLAFWCVGSWAKA